MICFLWNIDKQFLYEVNTKAIFGRALECEVCIDDENLSRQHFQIYHREDADGFMLEDLNSSNGTRCNTYEVKEPVQLSVGDIVQAGTYKYMYLTLDAIKENDKSSFVRLVPAFIPESYREDIRVKAFAFFKYPISQLDIIYKKRHEKYEKNIIISERQVELDVVDEKKSLIDQKKEELDRMYAEKMKIINEKYDEVEKVRKTVYEKFQPSIDERDGAINLLNNELEEFQTIYFIGSESDDLD